MEVQDDLSNFLFYRKDNKTQYFQRRMIEKIKTEIIRNNVSAMVCLGCNEEMEVISANSVGIASECPHCYNRTIVHFTGDLK